MVVAAAQALSSAVTWVMCIVMAILTGFLVSAPVVANSYQARMHRRYRRAQGIGPAPGGTLAAASVPGARAGEEAIPQGEVPTRADLPAQRTGDADRAARSLAGLETPGGEGPGRQGPPS